MPNQFDAQGFMADMEDRLNERLDRIEGKLDAIPDLETRVSLLEQRTDTLVKGVWVTFTGGVGAVFAFLFGYIKH